MKRLLILLSAVAALTLTACGNNNDEVVTTTTTTAATTTEAVVTTVPDTDEGTATEIITTEQEEVTTEITTIPEEVTTEATTTTEAAPAWVDEPMDNTTMYATTACYVRKDAVVGSDALYVVTAGKAVTIVGKTDTGYFKLSDGGYIHSDYLSTQKPVEEVVTTTAPVQTEEPTTTTEDPAPSYDLPEYNLTGATYKGIEIVITEEDIEAINDEIFRLTNELRVSLGLNELQRHPKLDMIARIRAHELTVNYDHARPDGSNNDGLCVEFNFGNSLGENITAVGLVNASNRNLKPFVFDGSTYQLNCTDIAKYAFDSWKNSSGHYANMVNTSINYLAVDLDIGYSNNNMQSQEFTPNYYYLFLTQSFR